MVGDRREQCQGADLAAPPAPRTLAS